MSIPVALTLSQPIFGVNTVKWDRKIEPVRYSEAKAEFMSATEEVAMSAISYFFNLLLARENHAIARQNLATAERLYEVAGEKRKMGRISENDLLQMELNLLEAQSDLTDCESSLKSNMFQLRSFLDYDGDVILVPEAPAELPAVDLTFGDALDKALANNKFSKNLLRRQLEADYEVAKARGDLRRIDLFARVKVAESNRRTIESQLRQESRNFNQDLFILVERFNNQQRQLDIARQATAIADRRYNTNVETFLIGKISTLDLNDSQAKKDQSRQTYINQLYLFWHYYYQLRSLTLWDYASSRPIDADIDAILRQ